MKEKANLKARLNALNLTNSWPYDEINLIQARYKKEITEHKKDADLIDDLNNFQLVISGSRSYVLSGKQIPKKQKELLREDFFESYPEYSFLRCRLNEYPAFQEELRVFEEARKILLNF